MHGATTRLVLEFRILGPLEIREGARILPPLAPKQRALLAAMLLRAGQFVSKQRLIDDVWGEDAPATVTNSLENQIWRLRQALGKDVVVTRSPGYVLAVEPEQVDALRLERLLGRARALDGEHPYRERLREQLMLALYRAGRQADALASYQAARAILTEELGAEPGEDLQDLQRAILQQDEALRAPPRQERTSEVPPTAPH